MASTQQKLEVALKAAQLADRTYFDQDLPTTLRHVELLEVKKNAKLFRAHSLQLRRVELVQEVLQRVVTLEKTMCITASQSDVPEFSSCVESMGMPFFGRCSLHVSDWSSADATTYIQQLTEAINNTPPACPLLEMPDGDTGSAANDLPAGADAGDDTATTTTTSSSATATAATASAMRTAMQKTKGLMSKKKWLDAGRKFKLGAFARAGWFGLVG